MNIFEGGGKKYLKKVFSRKKFVNVKIKKYDKL